MPKSNSNTKTAETVTLVSPDGSITRDDVVVGSAQDVSLRFDGYLPPEQAKLQAPERPSPSAPKTVGTNSTSEV